jgi:hypothetical protein
MRTKNCTFFLTYCLTSTQDIFIGAIFPPGSCEDAEEFGRNKQKKRSIGVRYFNGYLRGWIPIMRNWQYRGFASSFLSLLLQTLMSGYFCLAFHIPEPCGKELLLSEPQQIFPILRHLFTVFRHGRDLSIQEGVDKEIVSHFARCLR